MFLFTLVLHNLLFISPEKQKRATLQWLLTPSQLESQTSSCYMPSGCFLLMTTEMVYHHYFSIEFSWLSGQVSWLQDPCVIYDTTLTLPIGLKQNKCSHPTTRSPLRKLNQQAYIRIIELCARFYFKSYSPFGPRSGKLSLHSASYSTIHTGY